MIPGRLPFVKLDRSRREPVEIKLTATPTLRHLDPLDRLKPLLGADTTPEGLLVCTVEPERPLPGGNRVLPWRQFPEWLAGMLD
jgi:hypothetical protein